MSYTAVMMTTNNFFVLLNSLLIKKSLTFQKPICIHFIKGQTIKEEKRALSYKAKSTRLRYYKNSLMFSGLAVVK